MQLFCISIDFFATLRSLCLIMRSDSMLTFLFRTRFAKSSEIYRKQGQFKYHQKDFSLGSIQQLKYETTGDGKAFYLGQLKEGTDNQEGIGIAVYSRGDIYEGCWKDSKYNGKGRYNWNKRKQSPECSSNKKTQYYQNPPKSIFDVVYKEEKVYFCDQEEE